MCDTSAEPVLGSAALLEGLDHGEGKTVAIIGAAIGVPRTECYRSDPSEMRFLRHL